MSRISVEDVSPIERRISVEVPPEQVTGELERAYRTLSHRVKVPGFRPGKVPRRILEQRYKDQVEADVIQALVERSYLEALGQHPKLNPVAPPKVNNEGLKVGEAFRYQANVEVKPEIEPKEFEGLPLKKSAVEIGDEQVTQEVERLREAMAQLVPVEGRTVAEQGDFATVDFDGTVEGKPIPGGKMQDATMELVPGEFFEGNAAALVGASVGETRELDQVFPADYKLPELAGKTGHFKVTLKGLKTKKMPELGDALAKEVGGGDTLAQLKDRIRAELTSRAKEKAEREEREQLVTELIKRNPFEVPNAMVERALDRMLEGAFERFARQGMDPRRLNLDLDRMRDGLRDSALKEVKGTLLLEAIADKQQIACTDEDIQAKVKQLAEQLKAPEESVRSYLSSEDAMRGMRFRVREEKTLAFLTSKANIS